MKRPVDSILHMWKVLHLLYNSFRPFTRFGLNGMHAL